MTEAGALYSKNWNRSRVDGTDHAESSSGMPSSGGGRGRGDRAGAWPLEAGLVVVVAETGGLRIKAVGVAQQRLDDLEMRHGNKATTMAPYKLGNEGEKQPAATATAPARRAVGGAPRMWDAAGTLP